MLLRQAASAKFSLVTRGIFIAWLGALAMPASAASGLDTLCDDSDDQSAGLDVHVEILTADVVGHEEELGAMPGAPSTAAAELRTRATPLSDLKSSSVHEATSELTEKDPADSLSGDDDLPGPSSRFPGISDDEALRYRSQMYRTDI